MRAIEQEADSSGLTYAQMMENAGYGLAQAILGMVYEDERLDVVGLVGPGNNGGDTLVALAHLAAKGWHARAYLVSRSMQTDPLIERVRSAGAEIIVSAQDPGREMLSAFIGSAAVLMDGVLGTGFKPPMKREISNVLMAVKNALLETDTPPTIVAVDCPSGINCDTGEAGEETVPANVTITMAAVKQGLIKFPAFGLVGDIKVVDIGLTNELPSWRAVKDEVADNQIVGEIFPRRSDNSHKGTFGTVLIAAGSINYTGAALLAGRSAYRTGVGLVQMAVPGPLHSALAGQLPEATWILLPHEVGVISSEAAEVLLKNLDRASAILIGPGIGLEETTKNFLENLIKRKPSGKKSSARIGFVHADQETSGDRTGKLPPLVVDADGLRLIRKIEGWEKLLPARSILTPHPGEMAELTGKSVAEIQADRTNTAREFSKTWGHVVVLKGAFTVVAEPDGRTMVIPVASSALAKAGTGDVLAGIIAGLLGQDVEPYSAAVAGAWIHAQAGLSAMERIGTPASVTASDVADSISDVLMKFT
jgi:NAD(P)H-hydrate epimerase